MSVDKFIPEVWAADIMVNFHASAVIANTVARDYEGTATMGNVVHITQFGQPSVVDYAAGNDGAARTIKPQELTDTAKTILINKEKAFAFYVDDVDARQAAGSFAPVLRDASAGLVDDAETFLATTMLTDGTDRSGTTALTDGDAAFNFIKGLRTELSSSTVKAPLSDRVLLVNPEFSGLLLGADSKLVEVDTSGSAEGLRNATIGRLLGFNVVETPLLSPGAPACVAYHRSAVGYVGQLDKVEALRAPNKFADIMRGLHVYGGAVLRPEAILFYVEPSAG